MIGPGFAAAAFAGPILKLIGTCIGVGVIIGLLVGWIF
jgi:hypothetical protein